jgi:hypothetical protein
MRRYWVATLAVYYRGYLVAECTENDQTASSDVMSPAEEHPPYIYATNGYVDQTGPAVYYINGE